MTKGTAMDDLVGRLEDARNNRGAFVLQGPAYLMKLCGEAAQAIRDLGDGGVPLPPGRCECGCSQFARYDEPAPGGGFRKGRRFRCISCKREHDERSLVLP